MSRIVWHGFIEPGSQVRRGSGLQIRENFELSPHSARRL